MKGVSFVMRIVAGVLGVWALGIVPILIFCGQGWKQRLGVIPVVIVAWIFLRYAFRAR